MSFKSKRNLKHLYNTISLRIDKIEKQTNDINPSCKMVLLDAVQNLINTTKNEADKWGSNFDYESFANGILFNISAELLQSGRYLIRPGYFNPLGPGSRLYTVFCDCIDYAIEKGEVDTDWKKEQISVLWQNMNNL